MVSVDEIFSPGSFGDFSRETLGKTFKIFRGAQGRFRSLLSPDKIRNLIRHPDFVPSHLEVMLRGQQVPSAEFVTPCSDGPVAARVHLESFDLLIQAGASCLIQQTHHKDRALWELTKTVGEAFEEQVSANVYYGGPAA